MQKYLDEDQAVGGELQERNSFADDHVLKGFDFASPVFVERELVLEVASAGDRP